MGKAPAVDPNIANLVSIGDLNPGGFNPETDGPAFANWVGSYDPAHPNQYYQSPLPGFLQVGHCTTMARIARVVHDRFVFRPSLPRWSAEDYRPYIRQILDFDATKSPLAPPHGLAIVGYQNLFDFTSDPAIVNIFVQEMGDSINDVYTPGFGWGLFDNISSSSAEAQRARLVSMLSELRAGRFPILYLLKSTNHAVLVYRATYGTDQTGAPWVALSIYDSNLPGELEQMYFNVTTGHWVSDYGDFNDWEIWPYQT